MSDYKGIYYNDKKTPQYYEGGAHFRYKDLYFNLQSLLTSTQNQTTHKRTFTFSPNRQCIQKPKTRNVLFYNSKHIHNSNKTNSFFIQNKTTSTKQNDVIHHNTTFHKQQSLNNSNNSVSNVIMFHKTHLKSKTNNDINYCCFNGGALGCEKCSIINDELSKDSDERKEREYKKFNAKKIKMKLFRNCNNSGIEDGNNSNVSRNSKTFKLLNSSNKEGMVSKRNEMNDKMVYAYNYNGSASYRGNSFKNIIMRNCNGSVSKNNKKEKVSKTVYFK